METAKVLAIAHRGASGHRPENTIAAFRHAIKLGADMIELDARVCGSHEIVVMHDSKITFYGERIIKMTLKELRAHNKNIPTLIEVLKKIGGKIPINVELKDVDIADEVCHLIDICVANGGASYDDFIISSFLAGELKVARRLIPQLKISLLVGDNKWAMKNRWNKERWIEEMFAVAEELQVYSINMLHLIIDQRFVSMAHHRGMKIFAYTVDASRDIAKLKAMGVDGIFSNYPDRVK
jgi:glycerophosphoryl diester phosphodiesterase